MINYLIIDDESVAHEIIEGYCKLLPNMLLKKHCYNAIEALDYLNDQKVDLIFLDINMPQLKGFDFLKLLHHKPKVIVTTAYSEFALEGYELAIDDYLLKPFDFERFLKAINKTFSNNSATVITNTVTENQPRRIFLKESKKYIQIDMGTIIALESFGNYVKIQTVDGLITVRDKVANIMELLPEVDFVQVHKSFVIAIAHIEYIEGNQIKMEHAYVPIGKMYKMNVLALIK